MVLPTESQELLDLSGTPAYLEATYFRFRTCDYGEFVFNFNYLFMVIPELSDIWTLETGFLRIIIQSTNIFTNTFRQFTKLCKNVQSRFVRVGVLNC